ncbi:uncharacterized protein ColSpa_02384 [Colletotrichum spaethianum]|uniref:Uncharacterized protein n=1 Tax=Colletotrichum spaethianum TaxID=700344 RepID=A0AA37NZI9_9PEZI|nr:uncharacterized protein ColSpa_02384 [Colletotrichum spaethianum]GKT42203.1 hypothetical protein ColSpa_02384 [Colletotrichum spaethianum]
MAHMAHTGRHTCTLTGRALTGHLMDYPMVFLRQEAPMLLRKDSCLNERHTAALLPMRPEVL